MVLAGRAHRPAGPGVGKIAKCWAQAWWRRLRSCSDRESSCRFQSTVMRLLSNSDSLLVADCQTRLAVREADELRRVISGRLTGNPYLCQSSP